MARLSYIEKERATPEQEKILSQLTQKSGKIANIWKLWSHSPITLDAFMSFYKTLMKGSLDGKLRELAYIKTSLLNGCAYCAEAHQSLLSGYFLDHLNNSSAINEFRRLLVLSI